MAQMNRNGPGAIRRGLMSRLAHDQAGNMLSLTAASVIPILALLGGGIDVSRYYVTKSRLQNACDSAVLAARKSMNGTTWTTADNTVGQNFFKTNFPTGALGTSGSAITLTADGQGGVNGVASVTAPASLMAMFNYGNKALVANCKAEMQLPNTDIVFALDTTGSMNEINPGDSVTRIAALRTAVNGFYSTLSAAAPSGIQLRYGFVPFSSNVNVGRLLKREWMVDTWDYQSREPNGTTVTTWTDTWTETWVNGNWQYVSGGTSYAETTGSPENCVAPASTYSSSYSNTAWTYSPYNGGPAQQRTRTQTLTENGVYRSAWMSGGVCKIGATTYNNRVHTRTQTVIPVGGSTGGSYTTYFWRYKKINYDVSALKGSGGDGTMSGTSFVATGVGDYHADVTVNWNGCIEERDTVRNSTFPTIPAAAYDLDIDMVPAAGDPDTKKWRPFLPHLVYWRYNWQNWTTGVWNTSEHSTRSDGAASGQSAACPSAARKLGTMTASQVSTYVNSLTPSGFTYLDIGMIWAARLISPTGLFQSENQTAANGGTIARHIIYMTDGAIETRNYVYEAYGLAAIDRRRTAVGSVPSDSAQNSIVAERFSAVCEAAKAKGITVWTIAFGTALTTELTNCASPGRAFQASNATELNSTFAEIATNIAQLRLTE